MMSLIEPAKVPLSLPMLTKARFLLVFLSELISLLSNEKGVVIASTCVPLNSQSLKSDIPEPDNKCTTASDRPSNVPKIRISEKAYSFKSEN